MFSYIKIECDSLDTSSIISLKKDIHFYLREVLGSLDYIPATSIIFKIKSKSNFEYDIINVRQPMLVVELKNNIDSHKKGISAIISKYIK